MNSLSCFVTAYIKSKISKDIIIIEWQGGFSNVATIAKCGAELIHMLEVTKLANKVVINVNRIHIIGFSLGAHIAAQISNNLQKKYNIVLERITGEYVYALSIHFGIKIMEDINLNPSIGILNT